MNLSFMTHFPDGTPTDFVEKISSCLISDSKFLKSVEDTDWAMCNRYCRIYDPKIHTIRRGKRWRKGMKIHFRTWEGAPYQSKTNLFALYECKSAQDIEIRYSKSKKKVSVFIDGKLFFHSDDVQNLKSTKKFNALCINDGLETPEIFFKWFKDDFSGQIIHWTKKKY